MTAKQLNILELHKNINDKNVKRQQYFATILDSCHSKIKRASEKELYEYSYDVPEYTIGLPMYKLTDCIIYLYENLKKNGFFVKYYFPKTLYISWKPTTTNNDMIKNTKSLSNNYTYDSLLFKPSNNKNVSIPQIDHKQIKKKDNGKFILNLF